MLCLPRIKLLLNFFRNFERCNVDEMKSRVKRIYFGDAVIVNMTFFVPHGSILQRKILELRMRNEVHAYKFEVVMV